MYKYWTTGACVAAVHVAVSATAQDRDYDGLDDNFEQRLIDKYRPYILFDDKERFWPADVVWFMQRCELKCQRNGASWVEISQVQLASSCCMATDRVGAEVGNR